MTAATTGHPARPGPGARRTNGALAVTVVLAAAPLLVEAQLFTSFEPPDYPVGTTSGVVVDGSDGFYSPPLGFPPFLVYQRHNNDLLLLPTAMGRGDQFLGAEGPGPDEVAITERAVSLEGDDGVWTVAFDIAANYLGAGAAPLAISSFWLGDVPDEAGFAVIAEWNNPSSPTSWGISYGWFDSSGTMLVEEIQSDLFQTLYPRRWYRLSTTFDLDTNRILEVALTTIGSTPGGATDRIAVTDRYLAGGTAGADPPSSIRMIAGDPGGGGNAIGYDNLSIDRPGALIVQNRYPEDVAIIEEVLVFAGIPYDYVGIADLAAVDLERYHMVVVPGDQDATFYTAWNSSLGLLESYAAGGGRLWISSCADMAVAPEPLLPGGVVNANLLNDWNWVVAPNHPWVLGVPQTIGGEFVSYDALSNLPAGAEVVTVGYDFGGNTLVDYNVGSGRVLVTGQRLEWGWLNSGTEDQGVILPNSLKDMWSSLFDNGFESGDTGAWSGSAP